MVVQAAFNLKTRQGRREPSGLNLRTRREYVKLVAVSGRGQRPRPQAQWACGSVSTMRFRPLKSFGVALLALQLAASTGLCGLLCCVTTWARSAAAPQSP